MPQSDTSGLARLHIRFGWLSLALFALVGLALEGLHGFKAAWYLERANETRRLMFTLGHAHGALLSILNLVLGALLAAFPGAVLGATPSRLLLAATILMPGGFLLGGAFPYSGDPGLGILLVPVGALCLIAAALLCGLANWPTADAAAEPAPSPPKPTARRKTRKG